MKSTSFRPVTAALSTVLMLAAAGTALAFPPAPYHTVHGMVRDENGRPLANGEGDIHLLGTTGTRIVYSPVGSDAAAGENYRLRVPMDSAADGRLYQVNALRPSLPFTIRVVIRGVAYVPIQMQSGSWEMGAASGSTRLDLTLGVDSDGDGLPDSWEQNLILSDPAGRLRSLADVKPGDDLDGDGMSNLLEYQVGTYALEKLDALALEIVAVNEAAVSLRFAAVTGHTYRLKSSTDFQTWTTEPFALESGGALNATWRATDVRLVEAYVPRGEGTRKSFRLYVD